jgi:hypothetical protein
MMPVFFDIGGFAYLPLLPVSANTGEGGKYNKNAFAEA